MKECLGSFVSLELCSAIFGLFTQNCALQNKLAIVFLFCVIFPAILPQYEWHVFILSWQLFFVVSQFSNYDELGRCTCSTLETSSHSRVNFLLQTSAPPPLTKILNLRGLSPCEKPELNENVWYIIVFPSYDRLHPLQKCGKPFRNNIFAKWQFLQIEVPWPEFHSFKHKRNFRNTIRSSEKYI